MKRPGDDDEGRQTSGLGLQRLRVVLLVLTVFGVPMVLMASYLVMRGAAFRAPFADQPGGTLQGIVLHEDGTAADGSMVSILLHRRDARPEPYRTARTDADGRFRAEVPPLDGCYIVVAGGGTWIESAREVSLAGGDEPDLEFTLMPGCELTMRLERRDGSRIRGGDYELIRMDSSFGFKVPSAAVVGEFRGAEFTRGGLRPGNWTAKIELDDGTDVEFTLDGLAAGRIAPKLPAF